MTEPSTIARLYQGDPVALYIDLAENPNESLSQWLDALNALGMRRSAYTPGVKTDI